METKWNYYIKKLTKKIHHNKAGIINRNKAIQQLPHVPQKVCIKNEQKQQKTKNKYITETILNIKTEQKIGKLTTTHGKTIDKIHISNIKRLK